MPMHADTGVVSISIFWDPPTRAYLHPNNLTLSAKIWYDITHKAASS